MRLIVLIVVIWIIGSFVYGAKTNQLDTKPLVKEIEIFKREHPIATLVMVIVVVLIVIGILF